LASRLNARGLEGVIMSDVSNELIELERRFWKGMQAKDANAVLPLVADPCILTSAQGVHRLDKKTFGVMFAHMAFELKSYEMTDFFVEPLSETIATVGYKAQQEMLVEGELLKLQASYTSTWVRERASWVCKLHTENLFGDAFGRDKKA
jgi:ketosteroid isomerase-like protein